MAIKTLEQFGESSLFTELADAKTQSSPSQRLEALSGLPHLRRAVNLGLVDLGNDAGETPTFNADLIRDALVVLTDQVPVLKALKQQPNMKGFLKELRVIRTPSAESGTVKFAQFILDCIPDQTVYSEHEINFALRHILAPPLDIVSVRRLLVDAGALTRNAEGSTYRKAIAHC